MTSIMPQAQPWVEYALSAEQLEGRHAIAAALVADHLLDDQFLYAGLVHVLNQLQVAFFRVETAAGPQYHLVQLGQHIPDCERVILWRATTGPLTRHWYTADEHASATPYDSDLLSHLQAEKHLRLNAWQSKRHPQIAQPIHWQAYKLTAGRGDAWGRTVEGLQNLSNQGHSNQDIHDLLYHFETWCEHNPEFIGMPHEIVLRMHNLAAAIPLVNEWDWLKGC